MCGISGIINKNSNGFGISEIKAMTDIVRHRGPDDAGYVFIDNNKAHVCAGDTDTPKEVYTSNTPYKPVSDITLLKKQQYEVALGHRRLAILDLSPCGHCPISYSNGRYWITFNGEIYNFKELKTELEAFGHHFVSKTDTEVILAAYAQWGKECLHKFHGMWAFAIYDKEEKEIFLARDRFGIKPLYYWVSPNKSFCFASEIKQFTVLGGWQAQLNNQRAFDYLIYNMTDHTDETMFRGVYHIPAGHYYHSSINSIEANDSGKLALIKWYQPQYQCSNLSFEEAAASFEKYFKASVKGHLVADVEVGSALSGGLDSSSIVCEINNLLKASGKTNAQKAIAFCSSDDRYNEKKWVDEVVKYMNIDTYYVTENTDGIIEKALELIWYHDEPNQSQSELATFWVYRKANEEKIKVLINGQGADEYLSGYEAFTNFRWVQLLKKGKLKQLNYEIDNSTTYSNPGRAATYINLCYYMVPAFVRKFFRQKTNAYKTLTSIISLQKLKARDKHPYDEMDYKSNSIFNIAHRQLLHSPLPKYLRYEDRMSMANSVEARVPFLDHQLVEFTTHLPADYLDGLGEQKKILLHGLKNILPETIRSRKDKIGFVTSEEKWVKQQMTGEFRELLQYSIDNSSGIIKPEAMAYFDAIVKGTKPFNYNYWRLIAFGAWMKKFNVQAA